LIYRSNQYDLLLRSAATDAENGRIGASILPLFIIQSHVPPGVSGQRAEAVAAAVDVR